MPRLHRDWALLIVNAVSLNPASQRIWQELSSWREKAKETPLVQAKLTELEACLAANSLTREPENLLSNNTSES